MPSEPISDARLEELIANKREYVRKYCAVAAARVAGEDNLNALLELQAIRKQKAELLAALKDEISDFARLAGTCQKTVCFGTCICFTCRRARSIEAIRRAEGKEKTSE